MKTELRGKTAVVTGAAGTMGRAVASFLKEDGLNVVGLDVKGDCVHCDITDVSSVRKTLKQIGPVDVLVNNAGILSNHKVEATTPEEWRKVLAANLDGAFYLAREVIPGMKARRWGRIVNTCSLAAKTGGLTAGTAYAVSKGALTSLTFSLARELAPFGVTVNGISPAYVKTPMVTEQLTEAQRQALIAQIPVGRFCEPEEFAHVVRFLVSPLAGFITGEIVDLNGGLVMD
ncbi:MAG TPA: SDR family NAD(P)-dependent oxidoreductase [Burkholderiales bacterium]|nr:SDR family NAD(P)-dependent oxidoreductase [Burkholderiales bacterium]